MVSTVGQFTKVAAAAAIGALLMSSCADVSQEPAPLTTNSPVFAGLPKTVVAEVLSSPGRGKTIAEQGTNRDSMAQGAVRDFIMCRDMYRVYRAWVSTGQPPKPATPATPTKPLEPSNQETLAQFSRFVEAANSGDPSRIKQMITAESGCGSDVPLRPGDFSGPTLASAVKNL